jgi:hypothetical protein
MNILLSLIRSLSLSLSLSLSRKSATRVQLQSLRPSNTLNGETITQLPPSLEQLTERATKTNFLKKIPAKERFKIEILNGTEQQQQQQQPKQTVTMFIKTR